MVAQRLSAWFRGKDVAFFIYLVARVIAAVAAVMVGALVLYGMGRAWSWLRTPAYGVTEKQDVPGSGRFDSDRGIPERVPFAKAGGNSSVPPDRGSTDVREEDFSEEMYDEFGGRQLGLEALRQAEQRGFGGPAAKGLVGSPANVRAAINYLRRTKNNKRDPRGNGPDGDAGPPIGYLLTSSKSLTLRGHSDIVTSVGVSPDGKRIVSGSDDKTVKVWDAQTGDETHTLKGHTGYVQSVAFNPNGTRIVSGSNDKTVRVWNATTGKETVKISGHAKGVSCVRFSPDGTRIVSAGTYVKVWDATTGIEIITFDGHSTEFKDLAYSPDGKTLVAGPLNPEFRQFRLWKVESGQEKLTFRGHTGRVYGLCFSPDGQRIASGSQDQRVKIWDARTGKRVRTLMGHSVAVVSVGFSPDGKQIVSGSWDNTVKVWDVESGKEIFTLEGHSDSVTSVAFSPGGKRVVSGSEDETVKVWNLSAGAKSKK